MTALTLRHAAFAAALAPLALGLAACNKKQADGSAAAPSGDAIAKVAAPAGKQWSEVVSETADGGVVMGNPEAPLKLVEYGSLSCPHCAKLSQDGMAKLTGDYVASGRVSYEFRSFAIHPQDVPLTLLARCGTLDTFFPLVEQVYANFDAMNAPLGDKAVQEKANAAMQAPAAQRMVGLADALQYTQFFSARGISVDQAHACLADGARAQKIADLAQKYGQSGVEATPTLLLNGAKLNTTEWTEVEAALQKGGAR